MADDRFNRIKQFGAVLGTAGALVFTVLTPAQAAANDFNPGRIIDDALFYDGQALNAQQVQSFLDQQVPHGTSRSLRNYRQATTGKLPDVYCPGGYLGSSSETAAEIIAKVGRGCGVSQKALLVMLQKEQSLVTEANPSDYAYQRAMGYACPDTGPNYGANCDASYFGFHNQVWNAARQLKRYRDSGEFTWFPVGGAANIQYHPNPGCGTQRVNIENHATAGLYYYTPYVPNSSVLRGQPDNCAAYGNYNFHKLYNRWFGSAVNITVDNLFRALYNSNPARYGKPVTGAVVGSHGALEQRFEHATLFASHRQQISEVRGAIRGFYDLHGGSSSRFGIPRDNEYVEHGAYRQEFTNAHAVWTPRTGAAFLINGFKEAYLHPNHQLPRLLGAPYGLEERVADGYQQRTVHGSLFWSPQTAVTWTRNGFAAEHRRLGGAAGVLGFPINAEHKTGNYITQHFQNGAAYYTPETGAYAVVGEVDELYQHEGGPGGEYGLPISSETKVRGGFKQQFQGATMYRSEAGVAGAVRNGIRGYYEKHGGADGKLGLPLGVEIDLDTHVMQYFEHGVVFWSPQGTVAVYGAFHGELLENEAAVFKNYGHPVTEERIVSGGWAQNFKHATAYWSATSGVGFVKGAFRHDYEKLGATSSWLGFPVGGETQLRDGYRQKYQHGTAYWTPQQGIVYVKGAINGAFTEQFLEAGIFGWPLSNENKVGAGWSQQFEHGVVYWSPQTGIGFVRGTFADFYRGEGGETGWIGFPKGLEISSPYGVRQEFLHATLFHNTAGETFFIKGAIRAAFLRSGAESGRFGYPVTSEQNLGDNSYRQEFQKVIVTWTPETGVQVEPRS